MDGIGSHGLPAAGADRGEVLEPARRRAQRAPAELREPALRAGADGDAGGAVSAGIIRITGRRSARSTTSTRRGSTTCGEFFTHLLPPGNASLALAGDIDPDGGARAGARRTSANLPPGPPVDAGRPETPALAAETRLFLEDRVELPRLYLAWLTPAMFAPGDAELDLAADILANGKTSRLYRRLVFEERIATDVSAAQNSREIAGFLQVAATAAPGPLAGGARRGRSPRRSRGWRPTGRPRTRSSAAACRPRRSSCSGCRPSAASAASPTS